MPGGTCQRAERIKWQGGKRLLHLAVASRESVPKAFQLPTVLLFYPRCRCLFLFSSLITTPLLDRSGFWWFSLSSTSSSSQRPTETQTERKMMVSSRFTGQTLFQPLVPKLKRFSDSSQGWSPCNGPEEREEVGWSGKETGSFEDVSWSGRALQGEKERGRHWTSWLTSLSLTHPSLFHSLPHARSTVVCRSSKRKLGNTCWQHFSLYFEKQFLIVHKNIRSYEINQIQLCITLKSFVFNSWDESVTWILTSANMYFLVWEMLYFHISLVLGAEFFVLKIYFIKVFAVRAPLQTSWFKY